MAAGGSVQWRAVGASLNDLAQTMRAMPGNTPKVLAHMNSALLQQVGKVVLARYITPQNYAEMKRGRLNYTAPPGATHGPVRYGHHNPDGSYNRNARGQFVNVPIERKIFQRGVFVSRTGEMREVATDLSLSAPTERLGVIIADGENRRAGGTGTITIGIDADGSGYVTLTEGYRAAEAGKRGTVSVGTRGWWKAIRSVQGRWKTLLRKRYPDLFHLIRRAP